MNTEFWASLDQYTCFAKEPWLFNRPENLKEHSLLSKATFAEWPNTTSNFSLHRGVAPAGKLTAHNKPRFANQHAGEMLSPPSPSVASKNITTKKPPCAISDAQLRASISTNSGRSTQSIPARTTPNPQAPLSSAPQTKVVVRHSADNVTAAYTLLQDTAAQKRAASRKTEARRRTPTTQPARHAAPQPGQHHGQTEQPKDNEDQDHRRESSAIPNNWSVKNVGFNDIKSEARARIEIENKAGYVRAAFASQHADKHYIAEANNFRLRFPHTLGRIAALSEFRSDRVDARQDRLFTKYNHKHNKC